VKSFRKRSTLTLLAFFLLPVLVYCVWYGRQVRQKNLDHALIEAIKKEDTPEVIALLDHGADANATDKPYKPITPKSLLADFWDKSRGYRPIKPLFRPIHMGRTWPEDPPALELAVMANTENIDLIKVLIEHGADPNKQDADGQTPLFEACYAGNSETVLLLLEYGANPNVKDSDGNTPLMGCSTIDCVRLLVKHEAEISVNNYGKTALDSAKEREWKPVADLLEEALKKEQAHSGSRQ
jgi:ankyrin repeat protein